MEKQGLELETLKRLAAYDTPTVCNAIEMFDVRPRNQGYMNDRIRACYSEMPPMVGYAATATFRADAPGIGDVYASLGRQIESFADVPSPPIVVFQDLDDPPVAATFGEMMCASYQTFGSAGLITSGAGRDLAQVRELGFPVFTSGTICAHGYSHVESVQVPVRAGGITIYPGDLLHGDWNGVTTIPASIAAEVADVCEEIVNAESTVLNYLRAGSATIQGMVQARQESQHSMQRLRQQLVGRTRR